MIIMGNNDIYLWPSHWKKPTVCGNKGAISSNSVYATKAGLEILKSGGNAFDAAAAVSLVLSVVEPHHSGIGGGAFTLLHSTEKNRTFAMDSRGIAPKKAKKDLFIDNGKVMNEWKDIGGKCIAVPGLLKSIDVMLKNFGTMTFKDVAKPAIKYAKEGFGTSFIAELTMNDDSVLRKINNFKSFRNLYLKDDESIYKFGEIQKNIKLGNLLEELGEKGINSFYEGTIAQEIITSINNAGGCFTIEDLKEYEIKFRDIVETNYRGYTVKSFPAPGAGCTVLELLNIVENNDLQKLGHNSAEYIHLLSEAMKISFADRSIALADPDFSKVKFDKIIDKNYAKNKYKMIDQNAKDYIPDEEIEAKQYPGNTSHFSIIDENMNVVSQTQTVRDWFGSGVVVDKYGFVLNNAMSDFSASEGQITSQGLKYGNANAIEGGKTPLSSMSPSIVFKEEKPFLSIGAAGGPRIITGTFQGIVNAIDFDMLPEDLVNSPFINCISTNQGLELESNISKDTIEILRKQGHIPQIVAVNNVMSTMLNSVMIKNNKYYASSTKRVDGCGGTLSNENILLEGIVQE